MFVCLFVETDSTRSNDDYFFLFAGFLTRDISSLPNFARGAIFYNVFTVAIMYVQKLVYDLQHKVSISSLTLYLQHKVSISSLTMYLQHKVSISSLTMYLQAQQN